MSEKRSFDPSPTIAQELNLPLSGVRAVAKLLDESATVPFIARYRKEMTGSLDEVQIRAIEERRGYLTDLEKRRDTVLESIESQGKLTEELKKSILECTTKTALEDLYLPYKPKRRTRAMIAKERGLEPLADLLASQTMDGDPLSAAEAYINAEKEVPDAEAALAGARDILAERMAEDAEVRATCRKHLMETGEVQTEVLEDKKEERTKFEQYYDYNEPLAGIPSHRFLAIRRGEREGVLKVKLTCESEPMVRAILGKFNHQAASPFAEQVDQAARDSYQRLLLPSVETDVRLDLKTRSDEEAVKVFAENLRSILLAAPLGGRSVLGIDPGIRTGCKCVVVDSTGKFLAHDTIYPDRHKQAAEQTVLSFLVKYKPFAIAIGNGTAGRETEQFVRRLLKETNQQNVVVVSVNESGASVYSASDLAREEFPELDVSIRGSISIARRLQDPLAELVKIDPQSIGVGQYQHDVLQTLLHRKLDEVVESCVNFVGVELNTASAPLLSHVSGIGPTLAKKIIKHRDKNGAFRSRNDLRKVSGLGPKTFEQAAGFLRIATSENPLDNSAVHPERYDLVERMAEDLGVAMQELVGNEKLAGSIQLQPYVGDGVGLPTLQDILDELKKPGRDPRESFEPPKFRDDVMELTDVQPGMELEGIVTNVTQFGAFVDIGVHQDGLVHISELADHYVKDPHDVVKSGDKLTVRVLDVDVERKRISLSARKESEGFRGKRQPAPSGSGQAPRHDGGFSGPKRSKGGFGGGPKGQGAKAKKEEAELTYNPFAKLKR